MDREFTAAQYPTSQPPQEQHIQPGLESVMVPQPIFDNPNYKGSGKLKDKVALITGGDSGIGRAVAVAYAKEGADVVIVYLYEHEDAMLTKQLVESHGQRCLAIAADLTEEALCKAVVEATVEEFGRVDILVNNAAVQFIADSPEQITTEQFDLTFRTNIYAPFFLTRAALPHMRRGSSIINTASVVAYRGHEKLLDYSATKGALVVFTYSLALQLVKRGIRVNGVAPGPIWTPLIPASFTPEMVAKHGKDVPMQRAGQPVELASTYVYLASETDSSYVTGQILHVNGGAIING